MKTVAVICEYNPFTNGHLRHLEAARSETGADTVVCVMSGSFTQRGEAAILDKYQRAETAVRLGADMVVELPLLYAISPADNFAFGAIKIISALPDVAYLSFGSECGDVNLLQQTAAFLSDEPEEYKQLLAKAMADGYSYPKARGIALEEYATLHPETKPFADVLAGPNNTLALCYIQALAKLGLSDKIKLHTVKRDTDYNDLDTDTDYPSAGAIRSAVLSGHPEKIKGKVPDLTYNSLLNIKVGPTPLGDLCLFKIKEMSGYDLENYYDVNGGLHNRLKLAALDAVTFDQFLDNAKTKKYTLARLKRISLYALFDITQQLYDDAALLPPYIYVLAMKKDRKDILVALGEKGVNTLVKYSDIDKVDKRLRPLIKLDFKAQGVLNMVNRSDYINRKMILI